MIHMQAVAIPLEAEVEIPRKVWTREEAHALLDLGFPNADRLELINGDLINHMGKKHPHVLSGKPCSVSGCVLSLVSSGCFWNPRPRWQH